MSACIVRKNDIETMTAETRTHFLNENAVRQCKALGDLVGLKGIGIHHIELPPGRESTEYHFHHNEDECIYMLSGEVELLLGDNAYILSAGDFVGHPAGGEPHKMTNIGTTGATYLVIGQRLEIDVVDYPVLNKRLHLDGESSELEDLNGIDA